MTDYTCSTVQWARLYELLKLQDLDLAGFTQKTWEHKGDTYSKLTYGDYYFTFGPVKQMTAITASGGGEKGMAIEYRPDLRHPTQTTTCRYDYGDIETHFNKWAVALAQELDTTNPWVRIEALRLSISEIAPEKLPETPLSEPDKQRIRLAVDEVKENARKLDLPEEKLNIINAKLDHLIEASDRLAVRDWDQFVLGTLCKIAWKICIDMDDFREIIAPLWVTITSWVRDLLP